MSDIESLDHKAQNIGNHLRYILGLNDKVKNVFVAIKSTERQMDFLAENFCSSYPNIERSYLEAKSHICSRLFEHADALDLLVGFGSWACEDIDTSICKTGQLLFNLGANLMDSLMSDEPDTPETMKKSAESLKAIVDSFREYDREIRKYTKPLASALDNYNLYAARSLNSTEGRSR